MAGIPAIPVLNIPHCRRFNVDTGFDAEKLQILRHIEIRKP